jgi:hypothetical protein
MTNGYDTIGTLDKRYEITTYLNNTMIGFLEGNSDGLIELIVDNFKRRFDMIILRENVKIIIDNLQNPDRYCWSIHVDHVSQHYESVIVNLKYDSGFEL